MTRQELMSMKAGQFVNHRDYGVCNVIGHSLGRAVDLIIISDKTILGRKSFSEMRPETITVIESFDKAMEMATGMKRGQLSKEFEKQMEEL